MQEALPSVQHCHQHCNSDLVVVRSGYVELVRGSWSDRQGCTIIRSGGDRDSTKVALIGVVTA